MLSTRIRVLGKDTLCWLLVDRKCQKQNKILFKTIVDLINQLNYFLGMKRIVLIPLLLVLFSCVPTYKYKITTSIGDTFYCNFYNETGDECILFNKNPGLNNTPGEPFMFCGYYKIEKLK